MNLRTLRDRQVALAFIALFATMAASVASAAISARATRPAVVADVERQALRQPLQQTLVVPDVTRSAFVFAKATLSDAGFGWRVVGSVAGYSSSLVAEQWPRAGTRVVDTGAPTIRLRLRPNPGYPPIGVPQNLPLYSPTPIELSGA
jgi:hypothetical protein